MHMQTQSVQALQRVAPQNANHDFVARGHFESAVNAARLVRVQYSHQSKRQLVRECLQHLHAFLTAPRSGAAHE